MYRLNSCLLLSARARPSVYNNLTRRWARFRAQSTTAHQTNATNSNLVADRHKEVATTTRLLESIQKRLARYNQELDLGNGPVTVTLDDPLLAHIIRAETFGELVPLIRANYRAMNNEHVAQCFLTIRNLIHYSSNNNNLKFEIISSKEFAILANRTLKIARHLLPSECLTVFNVLRYLDVSVDTLLSQAVLQMIRYSINDYSIVELHRLVQLLKSLPETKSTLPSAIQLALPFALKHRIEQKEMNFYDRHQLLRCLEMIAFFGCDRFDGEALLKVLTALHKLNHSNWSPNEWVAMLMHLLRLNLPQTSEHASMVKALVQKCVTNIIDKNQLDTIPMSFLYSAFRDMQRNTWLYDQRLFEHICLHACDHFKLLDDDEIVKMVTPLCNLKYINYELLSLLAKRIETNCGDLPNVIKIFHLFSLPPDTNKIHDNFDKLAEIAKTSVGYENAVKKSRANFFNFLRHCLLLNVNIDNTFIGDQHHFRKDLEKAAQERTMTSNRYSFLKTISLIYQGLMHSDHVHISRQLYSDILDQLQPLVEELKELQLKELSNASQVEVDEIESIARKWTLNGSTLTRNYQTKSGLFVDILLPGDQLSSEVFPMISQSHMHNRSLGFILLGRHNYCREPKVIDRETQFQIDMLKKANIVPIVITDFTWNDTNDAEKELYLSNKIARALKNVNSFE